MEISVEKEPISKLGMVIGYAVSGLEVKFGWVTAQGFIYQSVNREAHSRPVHVTLVCVCVFVN
jgi:hypothetical protein